MSALVYNKAAMGTHSSRTLTYVICASANAFAFMACPILWRAKLSTDFVLNMVKEIVEKHYRALAGALQEVQTILCCEIVLAFIII